AAITFNYGGISSLTGDAQDGVNLVTFQDSLPGDQSFPPGVLGVALVVSAPAAGQIQFPNGNIVTADFAGQILDVDILFNPSPGALPFSPVGANNTLDLVPVAMHEVGHLLGLDHTGVLSSIMNPFAESGSGGEASRTLQTDDTISAAALYPASTFAAQTGSIAGNIASSTGSPIKAGHVIAVRSDGVPVASQISATEGSYTIAGLPPGNYRVLVEPLNGPVTINDLGGFYQDGGQSNFATTFLGGLQNPTTLTVSAGQPTPANLPLPATPASPLNINEIGLITGGTSFRWGANPLFLPRGKSYQVFVTGSNLTSDSTLTVSGPGIPDAATSGGNLPNSQPIRQQTLTIASDAALGPANVLLSNATSASAFSGGVVTTVNPAVGTPIRDGAGFSGTIAPGAIVSIFGADLAFGRGANGFEQAVAKPLPTNMGGVSVRLGNRYAPLYSVSPGQINAMVPFELTGSSAQLTVVTGPNASGNTVTVSVSPTAPGIFAVNQAGTGQGIILNASDNSVAAPVGSIPGRLTRPARPGDFIIIYTSGLGPVTPPLPSGVSPLDTPTPERRLTNPLTVRIGGQTIPAANVPFAGLNPLDIGLYQVNVQLPANVPTGNAVTVQLVTFEGQTSNTVTIAINP
ncbi:MAG: matrixin family metalloprotease, partial [Acidobacteria bacterium]|nr:matrixin family metalloprotease [Acidobacteriota bacterium]